MLDRDDIGESKSKQTRPSLQVKAEIGTGMKVLKAHRFQLAVDRLNSLAVERQVIIVRPGIGRHVGTLRRDQAHPTVLQECQRIGVRQIALVAKQTRTRGQDEGQLMQWSLARLEALRALGVPLTSLPSEFTANYMSGAVIGVTEWWLENEMPLTPEELARCTLQLSVSGLYPSGMDNSRALRETSPEVSVKAGWRDEA